MYDPELESAVAKIQKSDAPLSKADQYAQLKKFSNRQRLPNESEQQAFAKFIVTDPHGKQLYRTYTQTKGVSFAPRPDNTVAKTDDGQNPGLQKLHEIAEGLRKADPLLSRQQSVARALQTPEGARFALQDRKARVG